MIEKRKGEFILLIGLIILLFILNYPFIDNALGNFLTSYENAKVVRVIDGDTIVIDEGNQIKGTYGSPLSTPPYTTPSFQMQVSPYTNPSLNKSHVRLLGINSPEKGELYYDEAEKFLEGLILNKTIKLEKGREDKDKYGRLLRYIFINDKNINLKIVEEGLANFYFPSGKDVYYESFKEAWENCLKGNKNLCKKSVDKCSYCIELKKFDYQNQEIVFINSCNFFCELTGWNIKDEGRKKFIFPNLSLGKGEEVKIKVGNETNRNNVLFWKDEDYVWTSTGDSLFLRDEKGRLVIYENY